MSKQQTAVEWLLSELQTRLLIIKSEPDGSVRETMIDNFLIDTEQAKVMEKEQIKEGYIMSLLDSDNKIRRDAEDYYNQTYGTENSD